MRNCRICREKLAQADYLANRRAITSLSTMIDSRTEVYVCRSCGHAQSPDLPDVQAFYDHEYRISLQSDDHDQLYSMEADGPVFRTVHQAQLLMGLDICKGASMLDFGAAKATTTRHFLKLRPDVRPYVFDVSEDYCNHWDEWIARDAQATYELPDQWAGCFDLITLHFVLEHVEDPIKTLKYISKFLSSNGQVFFTVPDPISNSGDLLVVDHLNHFVPSSLHYAVEAADLSIVALRSDLFRGAYVVVAQKAKQFVRNPVKNQIADVLTLLTEWRHILDNFYTDLPPFNAKVKKVAVYGAGFYGALFSSMVEDDIVCFLDQNPHLQGTKMNGIPVLAPKGCPDVDLVIAALNPAKARDILSGDADWLPKSAQVIYPKASPR